MLVEGFCSSVTLWNSEQHQISELKGTLEVVHQGLLTFGDLGPLSINTKEMVNAIWNSKQIKMEYFLPQTKLKQYAGVSFFYLFVIQKWLWHSDASEGMTD